ncbi:pseudouridine synthase [Ceraceosorus guamensis]|uniref:Pseudouridine synthase n=1 Tax=Ceraceosorus guamensis TaxID=1522189 RepID=A0A316VUB3_9BASI|nr:pseudouridine synthase [Ceraceosorus guamensis]PWN40023.1 pseudouridine synthase [Ceraceosorus guamensis]
MSHSAAVPAVQQQQQLKRGQEVASAHANANAVQQGGTEQDGQQSSKRIKLDTDMGNAQQQQQQLGESSANVHTDAKASTSDSVDGPVADADGDDDGRGRDLRPNRNVGQNVSFDRGGGESRAVGEDGERGARLPKRKVAIYFGYCGIGYSGLQINPGVKTIEGDIFDAFCKVGAVSKENAVNPVKVGLQRAARTDRGVHAAGNLLTLKLILEAPNLPQGGVVGAVNDLLPEYVRIWGLTRVQNSFNARTSCDSRMYEYLLPTYVFLPPKPGSSMHDLLKHWHDKGVEHGKDVSLLGQLLQHPFWRSQGTEKSYAEDVVHKKKWRMDGEHVERVREAFQKYAGSHNFHNYTVGKSFRDRSAHRVMKHLEISDPKEIDGTEWLSIKFHGQSFMLHQIRKMIGLLVLVGRTGAPASLIPETYGPARIHVPKAPGLGLLLEEPLFGGYNLKVAKVQPGAEERSPVTYKDFAERMQAFKQTFIYDRIIKTEEETSEFAKWLNYLDVFQGPDFDYLNPRGNIPQSAILKVGEQRRAAGGQPKGAFRPEAVNTGTSAAQEGAQIEIDSEDEDAQALRGKMDEFDG